MPVSPISDLRIDSCCAISCCHFQPPSRQKDGNSYSQKIERAFDFQCSAQSIFHRDSFCHHSKTALFLLSPYSNIENATTTSSALTSLSFHNKQIKLTKGTISYLVKGVMLLLPPCHMSPLPTHTHTLLLALASTWPQRQCIKFLSRWKLFCCVVIFPPDHFPNPAPHTTADDSMEEVEAAQCPEHTPLQKV